ncbi:MAG: regulatory iron-sulfur-containing complex subunit RicT [bacterium]
MFDLKTAEIKCNERYQSLISSNLKNGSLNISGCLACGMEYQNRTPYDDRNISEVICCGLLGCHFCELNIDKQIELTQDDFVLVQNEDITEVAKIYETGEIVKIRRQKLGLFGEELPIILRKLNDEDFERLERNNCDEMRAFPLFTEKVSKYNLIMKLVSIHFQFDRKKLFFFYTADGRVDFRELAKDLASEFKTRIELRQIGVRDEAKRIGGVGMCGREYCCATFINNFRRIKTQFASEQNLSSNLSKLSGPCGKLKCCLSFEI